MHEVYYHQDDDSICTWTVEPIADVSASTLAELKDALVAMLAAVARPVLVEAGDTLVENKSDPLEIETRNGRRKGAEFRRFWAAFL